MSKNIQPLAPPTTIEKLGRPFLHFMHVEAAGGFVLLACTIIALAIANSPLAEAYANFWHTNISLQVGNHSLSHTLAHWINDGLMTIFFFVVGLEIKRELISGELKDRRAAMLPAMAALGGMIMPALFYFWHIRGEAGTSGWGIPMATDIAFVVGFLSLFGKRVPHGLKIFILSLAIVDDLGAILIIALFYSANISLLALGSGFLMLAFIVLLNRLGVRAIPIYIVFGSGVWFAFLLSGVHPTIAGVLLGLLTPASAWIGEKSFREVLLSLPERWSVHEANAKEDPKLAQVKHLIRTAKETVSPLERLEVSLHPWVAFFIMPVFALANAGVPIAAEAITAPVSLSVIMGLFFGKPLGILLFSWLAVSLLGARLPERVNWKIILGAGALAGIGFTMSIFIAGLALEDELLVAGKVGTLIGSSLSAAIGLLLLHLFLPKSPVSRK